MCIKACNTTYYGNQTVRKSAPSAIFALAVGRYVPPDLRGSGYVSPQHDLGTWATAPSVRLACEPLTEDLT